MKPTVYIETTIVSYLTSWPSRNVLRLAHQKITQDWWTTKRGAFRLYASDFVFDEASQGDHRAAKARLAKLSEIEILTTTTEVNRLAKALAAAMALPLRARVDAAHVATAAVYGVEFLLTWNCRHLANAMLADKIDATCGAGGYKAPRIVTPDLLMGAL